MYGLAERQNKKHVKTALVSIGNKKRCNLYRPGKSNGACQFKYPFLPRHRLFHHSWLQEILVAKKVAAYAIMMTIQNISEERVQQLKKYTTPMNKGRAAIDIGEIFLRSDIY